DLAEQYKAAALTASIQPKISTVKTFTSVMPAGAVKVSEVIQKPLGYEVVSTTAPKVVQQKAGFSSYVTTIYPKEETKVVKLAPVVKEAQLQAFATQQESLQKQMLEQAKAIDQALGTRAQVRTITPTQVQKQMAKLQVAQLQAFLKKQLAQRKVVTPTLPGYYVWPPALTGRVLNLPRIDFGSLTRRRTMQKRRSAYWEKIWPVLTGEQLARVMRKRLL
ncbi:MAG: hypothetical protein NZ942_03900, partial [Candidatus Aenigmarchaeota archaeon]|nr:hypothetical protein [Candidatus Aenigmarchaeota archaeon]